MKKLFASIFAFVLLLSLSYATTDTVKLTNGKLEKLSQSTLIGSFELKNTTDSYLSDIYYTVSLRKVSADGDAFTGVVKTYDPIKVSLMPKENKIIAFDVNFSDVLTTGRYAVFVQLDTRTLTLTQPTLLFSVPISGQNPQLLTSDGAAKSSYYFTTPNDPMTGPSFKANSQPKLTFNLKSNYDYDFKLTPQITVYKRSVQYSNEPVFSGKLDSFTLKPNETKKVEVKLPKFSEPESYLARIVFLDVKNEQVSYEYDARFVIKGEGSKITDITPTYNSDTNMIDINFSCVSSPDASALTNAKLNYSISENGNVILTKSHDIKKLVGEFSITDSIAFNSDSTYSVNATVTKSKTTLDSYQINIPANINTTKKNIYFTDTLGTKYEHSAKLLAGLNYISGYPDSTFKPINNITRAEMIVIASRLFDKKAYDNFTATSTSFTDTSSHWAHDFIEFACANGIASGYPDGTFKPNNNVTYQEALTILLNTIGRKYTATSLPSSWPNNYIEAAEKLQITPVLSSSTYPTPAIRGDISDMTVRAILRKER